MSAEAVAEESLAALLAELRRTPESEAIRLRLALDVAEFWKAEALRSRSAPTGYTIERHLGSIEIPSRGVVLPPVVVGGKKP